MTTLSPGEPPFALPGDIIHARDPNREFILLWKSPLPGCTESLAGRFDNELMFVLAVCSTVHYSTPTADSYESFYVMSSMGCGWLNVSTRRRRYLTVHSWRYASP